MFVARFDKWDAVLESAYHSFGNMFADQRALLNKTRPELREFDMELARVFEAATNLRKSQRAYMEVRNSSREIRDAVGRAVAHAAEELDAALASGMEAATAGETGTGSTEGDSPTAEGGDAQ